MNMLRAVISWAVCRRDKLDLVTAVPVLRCRRNNNWLGLWLREWADALTPRSLHLQQSIYFHLVPRLRIYRSPRQVWICWFGYSLHSLALSRPQSKTGGA
jgi:hypothetical protein